MPRPHPHRGRGALAGAVVFVATALLLAGLAAPAQAYSVEGKRWPGKTITVRDRSPYPFAVGEAIRRWNATGLRVRFKASKSKRANLVIRAESQAVSENFGGCAGYAQVGYVRGVQARMMLSGGCPDDLLTASTVAHELGHVLGLGHEGKACALMNPVLFNGAPNHCQVADLPQTGVWRCRVIEADDIAGVRRLYKGKPRVPVESDCPLYGAPPAPAITAVYDPAQYGAVVMVTPPPSPAPLLRIAGLPAPQPQVLLAAAPNACPAADAPVGEGAGLAEDQGIAEWAVPERVYPRTTLAPGRWCLAAWLVTPQGRSPQATTLLDVPVTRLG